MPPLINSSSAPSDRNLQLSDITTNNVSTSKHGFTPKAPNDTTKVLDGTGAYSYPMSNLYNPYKFNVYLNTAQNASTSQPVIAFDTANFDTSSNVDLTTHKGRFTAPVSGFYFFVTAFSVAISSVRIQPDFFKNGSFISSGSGMITSSSHGEVNASAFLQLTAGDYIEVGAYASATTAMSTGNGATMFAGHLICVT